MPNPPKPHRSKDHPKRDGYDKANLVLLFITFLAAVAAAGGVFYQAAIFHRQLAEMEKIYGPVQTQAVAATAAAKAAADATKIASDTQIAAYRAWLAPRSVDFVGEVKAGAPIRYKIFYQNVGN